MGDGRAFEAPEGYAGEDPRNGGAKRRQVHAVLGGADLHPPNAGGTATLSQGPTQHDAQQKREQAQDPDSRSVGLRGRLAHCDQDKGSAQQRVRYWMLDSNPCWQTHAGDRP